MSTAVIGDITGVEQLLKDLGRLDPEMRKELPTRMKTAPAVEALVRKIRDAQPELPMSGFARGKRLAWKVATVRKKITPRAQASMKASKDSRREFLVVQVSSTSPIQNIFELAMTGKTARGRNMSDVLTARYGRRSRTIYPAVVNMRDAVAGDMGRIVDQIADEVNRKVQS